MKTLVGTSVVKVTRRGQTTIPIEDQETVRNQRRRPPTRRSYRERNTVQAYTKTFGHGWNRCRVRNT